MVKFLFNIRKIRKVISDNFYDFSQNTVLYGFKYIGDRNISLCERFFFLICFLAILVFVITLTTDVYDKWDSTPIIVGLSPHPILINRLPFPTVTICNVNQIRASKVKNSSRDSVEYSMLQTLCDKSVDNVHPSKLAEIKNRSMFHKFIEESAQPCERLLVSCKFGMTTKKCDKLFKPVLTDEGQCCVFNFAHSSFIYKEQNQSASPNRIDDEEGVDWDPEDGYQNSLPKNFYPRVASGTGINMGLSIVINAEVEDYYCTSTNGPGFKLLLHNPIEMPTLRENGLFVKAGSEITFRIAADRSEASQNIRDFSIEDRQCVFKSERQLRYFRTYTKRNCEMECLANTTAKLCGCVRYYLPTKWTNLSACGLKDMSCLQPILYWTAESAVRIREQNCKDLCLQSCFDLSFIPARFHIPLTSGGYMINNKALEKFNTTYLQKNIAVVHFYYKLSNFDGFMRTRFVGITEFMSYTGGLIGLLGFSFIAVAEVMYFLLLKPLRPVGVWISNYVENIKNRNVK